MSLTPQQVLEILSRGKGQSNQPKRFWVDANGVKHTISGSVSSDIVGGFHLQTNRTRKYLHGNALYYKV